MLPRFIRGAYQAGLDVGPVLKEFGLAADMHQRTEALVPLDVAQAVPEALATRLDDPLFGLHLAGSVERGVLGVAEFTFRNAPNLGGFCERMHRYSRLVDDVTACTFDASGSEPCVQLRIPGQPACFGRHGNEFAIAHLVRLMRDVLPVGWDPKRIYFAHRRPRNFSGLASFFRTSSIEFGCRFNGIGMRSSDLALPLLGSDAALLTVLDEQARRLVAESQMPALEDTWHRIRDQIRRELRGGAVRLERVAGALGMTTRTLQRRLEQRGTQFHDLVDDVRHQHAIAHLKDESLSLAEVARRSGYRHVSSFVRAFERFAGVSPGAYRSAHKHRPS
jgi:AraC-like DNA-binding protein